MRTIKFSVYFYLELGDNAREKARNNVRSEVADVLSELDWQEAKDTIARLERISHVKVGWEQNSQGFYYNFTRYTGSGKQSELIHQLWAHILNVVDAEFKSTWADEDMKDIIKTYVVDETHTFAWNIANIVIEFCKKVYDGTLTYYDDECVEEYIIENEYEFKADGTRYIG